MTTVPPVSDAVQEVLTKSEEISARLDALTQTAEVPDFESRDREASAALETAINEKNEPEIRRLVSLGEDLLNQELEDRQKQLEEAESEFDEALKNNPSESPEVSAASERVRVWRESVDAFREYITQRLAYYNVEEILEHLNEAVAPVAEPTPVEPAIETEPTPPILEAAPAQPESLDERITRLRAKRDEYLAELKQMETDLKIQELQASISK
jgi:tetratricopeptide (TPR) repeat protein